MPIKIDNTSSDADNNASDLKQRVQSLEAELSAERESHLRTKIKLKMREGENHAIASSTSYKLARILASSKQGARIGIGHVRGMNPKTRTMLARNRRLVRTAYASDDFTQAFRAKPTAEFAVIIHLYYVDMLPYFMARLKNLASIKFDLFITIPSHKKAFIDDVKKILPTARVAIVPNGGRDVLPFVQVMRQIENWDYTGVLKLHSKKSPHRDDGAEWRDRIVDNLLPDDSAALASIQDVLRQNDTALIGPKGEYVSMLVNLSATARYIKQLTAKIVSKNASGQIMRHPDEYGFFGGTMFWARVDALRPVIDCVTSNDFEPEFGQEDSTMAHALERLFNVIPELQNKRLYDISNGRVSSIAYPSTNIPKWAEVALED